MRLKSISFRGFMGIPDEAQHALKLDDFSGWNVFIGPNNAGKSLLMRFFHIVRPVLSGVYDYSKPVSNLDSGSRFLFWHAATGSVIRAHLTFQDDSDPDVMFGGALKLVHHGEIRCDVEVRQSTGGPEVVDVLVVPQLWRTDGQWVPACRLSESHPPKVDWINDDGKYQGPNDSCPYRERFSALAQVDSRTLMFDAVRSLTHESRGNRERVDDGSKLLAELCDRSQSQELQPEWGAFRAELEKRLNSIFTGCGMPGVRNISMTRNRKNMPVMSLEFTHSPGVLVSTTQLGSGISQLVIVLAGLIDNRDKNPIVFIEEPETNLHPGLLRRFVDEVRDLGSAQFCITTHSPILLDTLRDGDRVYHFHQNEQGMSVARPCQHVVDKHRLLDSLGVPASTVLQARCVIWVEGPSDRLYIRRWLATYAPELREGSDYSFVFYGSGPLAHCSLDAAEPSEEGVQDFVDILSMCRFSAVIMDRDLSPGQSDDSLKPAKRRIRDEAGKDGDHRLAIITDGREIENDLPIDVIRAAVANVLGSEVGESAVRSLLLNGEDGFEKEVPAMLGLSDDAKGRATRKLGHKVQFAEAVMEEWDKHVTVADAPQYVFRLIELIQRARAPGTS